jgi:LacI family transcriptional regulator
LAVAADLGYVAHGPARALASRRSHTLGAIIPTLNHPMFARGVDAFQRRLEERGYVLLLTSSEYDAGRELLRAQAMIERGVDGLMLVGAKHDPKLLKLLASRDKPFVNAWASSRNTNHPCVGYDGRLVSKMVVDFLVRLGHREFALITGHAQRNDRVEARIAGMVTALGKHGLLLKPEYLIQTDYSIEDGRLALARLRQASALPSVVVCANDILAAGVLFEALANSINVPGELSIVGMSDIDLSAHTSPAITTVKTPKAEIGRGAADYLLARLEGEDMPAPADFDIALIVRGTTAAPRRRTIRSQRRH